MTAEARFRALRDAAAPATTVDLFSLFDALAPLPTAALRGDWEGGLLASGHPGERLLAKLAWCGKRFHADDDVDPLVCRAPDGSRAIVPAMGKATLRAVDYRGARSAAMAYTDHPVVDHFRAVADGLVVGVMEREGDAAPLFFWLKKLG